MKILVTGSSGLIGSENVRYFDSLGCEVHGVDNNNRRVFFGPSGDVTWNTDKLQRECKNFHHHDMDICDKDAVDSLFAKHAFDAIIHCAAQPSHDKAASIPLLDFNVNAVGTLHLLEATRNHSINSPFVHMSTNKVYGDGPNFIELKELETRWDYADPAYANGISESFSVDQCTHSLFGASKLSGDILVQEYGRYFGMSTCCLRGGCLTGPSHSGVELHGYLSYIIKCALEGKQYTIFGYKGKQVRDNIHSLDVARFIDLFIQKPRSGEVYNIGGGKNNSVSILETIDIIADVSGKQLNYEYSDVNRIGDHICYYSDLTKMKEHYPDWDIRISARECIEEICAAWSDRASS